MRECFGSGPLKRKKPLSTSNTRKGEVKPEANKPASGNGAVASLLLTGCLGRAVPDPGRYAI